MPVGTLVSASTNLGNSDAERGNGSRRLFEASNSEIIAILEDASGGLSYRTSSDGLAWGTEAPLFTGNAANIYGSISYHADVLYVLYLEGADLHLTTVPYTTGTNTFGTALTYTPLAPSALSGGEAAVDLDAAWDAAHGVFHVVIAQNNALTSYKITDGGVWQGGVQIGYPTARSAGRVRGVQVVSATTSTITVLYQNGTAGALYLWPGTCIADGSLSYGAQEIVSSSSTLFAASSLDGSGNTDILYVDGSFRLRATKRTGIGSYTAAVNVAAGVNGSFPSLSLTPNRSDLYAVYSSTANRATGELYAAQRTGGAWQPPGLLVGGDASGYAVPRTSPTVNGTRIDVAYVTGGSVYYGTLPTGSAPNTPVPLSPSGNETSLTPTITATYSNRNSADLQLSTEYQVKQGATIVWDSGEITVGLTTNVYGTNSNTGDANYVAPATLAYGTAYTWSKRDKDTALGLWSGWSTPMSFTPVRGGTVTLTDVTDNAVSTGSSPVTLTAPTIDSITASWAQTDGHDFDGYQDTIWNATQTAVVDQTALTTIPAQSTPYTSGTWVATHLVNSTTYKIVRAYRDATTGLLSFSAAWTLTTAWAPPPSVTGFTVTVTYPAGTANGTWTNPGGAATDLVERSVDGGTTWVAVKSGSLFTTFSDPAPLGVPLLYRVTDINALGIAATPVVSSPVTVGANGMFGVCLTDSRFPSVFVWLGVLDQGDWKNASQFTGPDDIYSQAPFGQEIPFSSKRLQAFGLAQSRAYTVPMVGWYADGTPTDGPTQIATLKAMAKVYNACQYRDVLGRSFYVVIENVQDGYSGSGHPLLRVQFDLRQTPGPISLVI